MRRAVLAGLALGVIAGLLIVNHDVLRLSVAWPVVLGFAMWGVVGREGSRGLNVAVASAVGSALGYLTYTIVAEILPITNVWLGIVAGVAVGIMVIAGLTVGQWLPLTAMLVGYAAFAGIFEPLWERSPAAVRTDGIETLTVSILAVLVGVLSVTVVRAVADRVEPVASRKATPDTADSAQSVASGRAS